MKWLSSSLTSQVVSLVMLHESQPRRSQRNRPWPLEKPQPCYVYCLFEDTALLSDLHLPQSLLWEQGAWTFIVVQGAGPCSDQGHGPATYQPPRHEQQKLYQTEKSKLSLLFNIFTTFAQTALLLQGS